MTQAGIAPLTPAYEPDDSGEPVFSWGPRNRQRLFNALAAAWPPPWENGPLLPLESLAVHGAGHVDLSSPQGRFELLALAVLLAAKVRTDVAVHTFLVLRQQGLMDCRRLVADPEACECAILEILLSDYRALTVKEQKARALVRNARLLVERYGGDLLNVHAGAGQFSATLSNLQFFSHISSRAPWIAREMRRFGLWPEMPPEATRVLDFPVRLALWRLGLVEGSGQMKEIPLAHFAQAAEDVPDLLPLYYQGTRRCMRRDPAVCRDQCRVLRFCQRRPGALRLGLLGVARQRPDAAEAAGKGQAEAKDSSGPPGRQDAGVG